MDDKAQMMVLESIIFAIIILLSLVFLFQLSPSSTVGEKYTNTLKIRGDDALRSLYTDPANNTSGYPLDYPSNKLVYYPITNNYTNFTRDLNKTLPDTVMYNIWISNGIKTIFWCNSFAETTAPLQAIGSITTSHYFIAIDPTYRTNKTGIFSGKYIQGRHSDDGYDINPRSDLDHYSAFKGYEGSTYDVILEMWQIT